MRALCYLAGPMSKGNIEKNVYSGLGQADEILDRFGAELIPFVPHLSYWWDQHAPRSHQEWLDYDFDIIRRCDILYRMPGESKGADMEVQFMGSLGRPVVHSMEQLEKWLAARRKAAEYEVARAASDDRLAHCG